MINTLKTITWRCCCDLAMWYAVPSSHVTTAGSFAVELNKEWQLLAGWSVFWGRGGLFSGSRRGDVGGTEGKIAAVWLQSTNLSPPSKGLMASVMRGVKDCCRCGHPQDNRAGSYFCVSGGGKSDLDNCCPEAHFINSDSWWCVCFRLVFLIFWWWNMGLTAAKAFSRWNRTN